MIAALEDIRSRLFALEFWESQVQIVHQIGHPLRGDFDSADAERGEALGNSIQNHRVEAADHHELGGENCLMIGSDYNHADNASELLALKRLKDNGDIDPAVIDKILCINPARFYGLD